MEIIQVNEQGWREGEEVRGKEERKKVVETNEHPGQDYDEEILVSLNFG